VNLLLTFAVVDIWGFLLMNPYWLLRAFGKTPNISHATTTGLESAGEKQLNPTVPELIENLLFFNLKPVIFCTNRIAFVVED